MKDEIISKMFVGDGSLLVNLPSVLKVKKLDPAATLPIKANDTDSGYDVVATSDAEWHESGTYLEYKTGISVEVPTGYHIELFPRSSISKYDLILANSIGLVDNGYRGEILFRFKYIPRFAVEEGNLVQLPPLFYKKGDKIGQIVIRGSVIHFEAKEVEELSDTKRGAGGFGSSDKK